MTVAVATHDVVPVAAVRRKVESWLAEEGPHQAIALRARPEWTDEPVITVGSHTVRVVACRTPLAARAALHERTGAQLLVLLTDLTDQELGDGVLAQVSKCTVRSVDPWDLVRQMFGLDALDSTLAERRYGGGRWLADALTDLAPADGWPPAPGAVLTRDHALRCLAGEALKLDHDQLDSAGLLEWTTNAPAVLEFTKLPEPVVEGITTFLVDTVGPAAVAVMAAVKAGHGIDAIPLGLLAAALWPAPVTPAQAGTAQTGRTATDQSPASVATAIAGTAIVVARTRLEPRFGGVRLTDQQAHAFRAAAEAWVDRATDTEDRTAAYRMLARAEALAAEIDASALLEGSDLLPAGFVHRMRTLARTIAQAVDGGVSPASLAEAERALTLVEQHRSVERGPGNAADDPHGSGERTQRNTARMAVRLLRWLSTVDTDEPATLLDALHRQVREDAWVDRARLDIFAGSTDVQVATAYGRLYRAVDARRRAHDQQFAVQLAAATASDVEPGTLLRVEDVLERVVRPILDRGRRVLLLVLDGMSTAAATELAEGVLRSGGWLEVTPGGGPRTGVLAALPTITEVSRCSLLSGRIAVGHQAEESAALRQRFPGSLLLHKGALRAGAGAALDPDVVTAVEDAFVPLVAAVVNTIDDALDRGDPGTIVWDRENINSVRDLLAVARERVVVMVSDHGHVIDRGPESVTRPSPSNENRWRPAEPPAGDGEVLMTGPRVAVGGGKVVLPWREELRYGPRRAGYHGGAAPAEAVIPLMVFSVLDENAVPGWQGAPVASPAWWRGPVADVSPPSVAPTTVPERRRAHRMPEPGPALFELATKTEPTPALAPTAAGRPPVVELLLGSDMYAQRNSGRTKMDNERVAALLTVLLAGGGRASLETLAADAAVPVHRISNTITALRKLLQVEGYPVLEIDPDGTTVKLNQALLAEQFHLDVR